MIAELSALIAPATTALVSVDLQVGFGRDSWEPVPLAKAGCPQFHSCSAGLARGRRNGSFTSIPSTRWSVALRGRMTDFASDVADALRKAPATTFYDGVVQESDILVSKTCFGAVISSDLLAQLQSRKLDTAVVGGLAAPIRVQTTVDGLSMSGIESRPARGSLRVASNRPVFRRASPSGGCRAHGLCFRAD